MSRFYDRGIARCGFAAVFSMALCGIGAAASGATPAETYPDHGACDYFGPTNGIRLHTRADDYRAMERRAQIQRWVVDRLPAARSQRVPFTPSRSSTAIPAGACSGIDECIQSVAATAGIPFASLVSDEEFLRRARLDLTGRIPTPKEVIDFVSDPAVDKRANLVDRLLQTPEWADRWTMFFAELLQNTYRTAMFQRYEQGRDAFHLYLLESMQRNKPYDQMVREMLAAEGVTDGREHPDSYAGDVDFFLTNYRNYDINPVGPSPVSYVAGGYTRGGPREDTYDSLASMVSRHFLGVSTMECVLCHDGAGHLDSLSVWGTRALRLEGWNLAAFFSRMSGPNKMKKSLRAKKKNGQPYNVQYYIVRDLPEGARGEDEETGYYRAQSQGGNRPDRLHPEKYVAARYPFESEVTDAPNLRLREQLGHHLTSDPQFARAAVNYIWAEFFTRGIVEPPDEFDPDRLLAGEALPEGWDVQPSHPGLLDWLAKGFRDSGFNLKWLMRQIATSQTYQLSSRYEGLYSPSYDRYFVRHAVEPLTSEQVLDAITIATGVSAQYRVSKFLGDVSYAMQLPDVKRMPQVMTEAGDPSGATQLLDAFNRGNRDDVPRSRTVSPLQALNLMNNPFLLGRISAERPQGTLQDALDSPDDSLVTLLYLSVLNRFPTEGERQVAMASLLQGDRGRRASQLMWALFNKTDFFFNY